MIGFYDYTVILTYMSLLSAVGGIALVTSGHPILATFCLLFCGLCDMFDGKVARSKKNRTAEEKSFGIQIDSLCDVVSFGVAPAFSLYCMGVDSIPGIAILCGFCICAVCRLGFFNVQEAKRQQVESGSNKYYRGLPVTSISMIFPLVYLFHGLFTAEVFALILHGMLLAVAFLFVLDFRVKKPDLKKLVAR